MIESTQLDETIWDDESLPQNTIIGKYIAISGNTGAGKSTLIAQVVYQCKMEGIDVIGINERALHHPFLKLMFSRPQEFAFLVQLNFLIQRYAVIMRHLTLGKTVVIERSHWDDRMFVEQHVEVGNINKDDYQAYLHLAKTLNTKLPSPDIFVCLDVKPETSMLRLKLSEDRGERPVEFPNEVVKQDFVYDWSRRYIAFHEQLAQGHSGYDTSNTLCLKYSAEEQTSDISESIMTQLR